MACRYSEGGDRFKQQPASQKPAGFYEANLKDMKSQVLQTEVALRTARCTANPYHCGAVSSNTELTVITEMVEVAYKVSWMRSQCNLKSHFPSFMYFGLLANLVTEGSKTRKAEHVMGWMQVTFLT